MNPRIPSPLRYVGAFALCLAFSSCGDDPELVRRRDQQRAEIRKLEGELSVLQEKMDQLPPDRSSEVGQLKQDTEANRSQIAGLESEIAELESKKATIEKEHEAYRRKYPVR